ncbi:hypothetical protein GCM10020254_02680 [Streptomyces goshikiensis]
MFATVAPAPGPSGVERTASVSAVAARWARMPALLAGAGSAVAESHMSEGGPEKRVLPWSSVTLRLPVLSEATFRPSASTPKCSFFSAGFAAACAVWTIRTRRQPPSLFAVRRRSMSGRTFL